MSWTAFVMPVHRMTADMVDWAADIGVKVGSIEPLPLPTVDQVLAALTAAGCHGDSWFGPLESLLPRCPNPGECAGRGGLDLGEVSITVSGDLARPIGIHDLVELISLRKPRGVAILHATIALAALGGPQLVFDDSVDHVAVVTADDGLEGLAEVWPWSI